MTDRNGNPVYRSKISQLVSNEGKSLVVDFGDLLKYNSDLANRVLLEPDSSLASFRIAAFETMRSENALYADRVKRELTVRLRSLTDLVPLRKVDTSYIDHMIAISGMVVRTSELRPMMTEAAWLCPSGHLTYEMQDDLVLKRPPKCELCGEVRNFELDRKHSRFIDFQVVRVQELPEELPPGQLPQFFDVNVEGDIVNTARPGDRVVLTGVVRAVPDYTLGQVKTRLFRSQIDCNHVEVRGKEPEQVQISKEDEELIRKIAAFPDAYERLVNSIAPVILGHQAEKEAILLLLTGGSATALPDGTKLRGDVNTLFVGDPGTGKSELLKFASQVAPRGLYASGRGTTAAGLSAAVIREKNVLMLEAGVVVLADLGIACLHPSSKVIFNDRIMSVSELAGRVDFIKSVGESGISEIGLIDGWLPSFDEADSKVKLNHAKKIRRRLHSGSLVRLSFRSGNQLLLTPDHQLLDGNSLGWKAAEKFTIGEFAIAPMRIPTPTRDTLYLWDILPGTSVVSLTDTQKANLREVLEAKFGTLAEAGRQIGVPRLQSFFRNRLQPTLTELRKTTAALGVDQEWKRNHYVYDGCFVASATLTPEMGYLCGFVRGDAAVNISRHRASMVVTQSPRHQAYIDRFREYWEPVFGPLSFRKRSTECRVSGTGFVGERIEWSVGKRAFGHIYEYVTGTSFGNILTLPDEVLRGVISGLTDADGCHGKKSCLKKGKRYETWNVTYEISSDETTNLSFLLALRRFGVVGSYKGVRKGVGIVVISARSDVEKLQRALRMYSVKMEKIPGARRHVVSGVSEKLPASLVQGSFTEAFDGMRTTEFGREGVSSTIYDYKKMVRQPSVGQVLEVIERHSGIRPETLGGLTSLLDKEYFLDEIIAIESTPYCGYVYDLIMEGTHNFVANGVIVHNCIDEFEKMKPEDRTALHEMMEQQTVTVAKGGIYATLNARTAILAACNPVLGRYNPFQNITENIGTLPLPLLSVGPDEQVLLRANGVVQSKKIGEFVDSFYEPGHEGHPVFVESKGIEVASVGEDFKIQWQPLRYVFRHRSPDDLYRIGFKGRSLILTGGHSIYTFAKGHFVLKPASTLMEGDYVAFAKQLPNQGTLRGRYNILDYISRNGAYLHGVPKKALARLAGLQQYERRLRRVPAMRFRELVADELARVSISRQGSGFYVPAYVPVDKRLFRLLGYFVAEGSMVYNESEGVYAVDFALDTKKDRKIVSEIVRISESLFKVKPTIAYDKRKTSVRVDIRSKVVVEFLMGCFGLKSGAQEKRIPDIVFNAPDSLKRDFVEAYYAGDAGVTTSKELSSQLLQLFAQMGHVASVFETEAHESVIEGRRVMSTDSYLVPIPKTAPQSNNGLCYPPLSEVVPALKPILGGLAPTKVDGRALTPKRWAELRNAIYVQSKISKLGEVSARPGTVTNLANRFGITEGSCSEFISNMVWLGMVQKERVLTSSGRQIFCMLTPEGENVLETVNYLDRVVSGDVSFARIDAVEKAEAEETPEYVYDLSVPGSENFIADTAVCHNSRFDLIFVFRDQPTPAEDERLASHILAVHLKRTYATPPPIEFSLLKKYLTYAKRQSPELTKEAMERMKDFYLQLRKTGGTEDTIPPTPRTLEALIRLSTARAKVLLKDSVTEEDALAAIALMNRMVEDVLTDATTKKTDFGIQFGKPAGETKNMRAALEVLKNLEGADKKPVERRQFKEELVKARFSDEDAEKMIRTMFREGMVYESKPGFLRRLGG